MKTRFLTACAAALFMLTLVQCDLFEKAADCSDPLNTNSLTCSDNCAKVVRLDGPIVWGYETGTDKFTITIKFDKDIDATASHFADGNSLVVYRRTDQDPATNDGNGISGKISGSGKVWQFTSDAIGATVIKDPANQFEIAVENNGPDGIGVRSTDGGPFDADSDCDNLTSEHREFHKF